MTQIRMTFFSQQLGRTTEMAVLLPSYENVPSEGCPVLYLLHGYSDGYSSFLANVPLESYLGGSPFCVVMPAGEKSFYTDMAHGDAFFSFISRELPELIQSYFPVSRDYRKTFVGGVSMGGYGALKLALTYPEQYGGVLAIAPTADIARLVREGMPAGDLWAPEIPKCFFENAFGSRRLQESGDELFSLADQMKTAQGPPIYFYCGTEDFLYKDVLRFREYCVERGMDAPLITAEGNHAWVTWLPFIQDGIGKLKALLSLDP